MPKNQEYRDATPDELRQQSENALRTAVKLATSFRNRGDRKQYIEDRPLGDYEGSLPSLIKSSGRNENLIFYLQTKTRGQDPAQILDIGSAKEGIAMD